VRNRNAANGKKPGLVVADTQYGAPSEAYALFRDTMRSHGLPWTLKQIDGTTFRARNETIPLDRGGFGRLKSVPTEYRRTKADVAHSSCENFCAFYILSGSAALEQGGRTNLAHRGDLLLFDSAAPATVTNLASPGHSMTDTMGLMFPKELFKDIAAPERFFDNMHVPRDKILNPLASTLSYMATRLISSSYEELNALFEATVHLTLFGASSYSGERDDALRCPDTALFRNLITFIEDNLTKPTLSAALAAKDLRISESYVHRMFASMGTSFSAYVTGKRLDRVRVDLLSPDARRTPISVVAYKCGFNDLSTFNRTFRKRFGCTPRELRE
jgi:AraC family transcriptional regulator, positive regulator of tynA and feaB